MSIFFHIHPALWIFFFSIFGLIMGSFLNVVIFRLPIILARQSGLESLETSGTLHQAKLSVAWPSSFCPHCGTSLRWWQNIPIISYLLLRGHCAVCNTSISAQYPLVELSSFVVSGFLAYFYGFTPACFFIWVFFAFSLCLAVIDMRHGFLPDILCYCLLWIGLVLSIPHLFISSHNAIMGALMGYFSLWSIFWIFKALTGKEGMGYGDFKLNAAIGAWVGWDVLPLVLLLAAASGLAYALSQIIQGKAQRETPFAFGPYLALAGFLMLIWISLPAS